MNEQHFWNYLLQLSESLDTLQEDGDARRQLLEYLETMDEAFGRSFDPVDEFEQYSVVTLCKSIRKLLAAAA